VEQRARQALGEMAADTVQLALLKYQFQGSWPCSPLQVLQDDLALLVKKRVVRAWDLRASNQSHSCCFLEGFNNVLSWVVPIYNILKITLANCLHSEITTLATSTGIRRGCFKNQQLSFFSSEDSDF
jgi:hypothetical protein